MFIDHTKQIEKYLSNLSPDKTKGVVTMEDGVFSYVKTQETYRMTEKGSFFMPDAVYKKPDGKEEETIVEQLDTQMDMSAANRKNQMIVVTNTASPQDLKEISKDGFSSLDMESHKILTVTDKIKAVLAKAGVDISIYGDSLSLEQLEEVTGSRSMANQIMSALKKTDLPITEDNINESIAAYDTAKELHPLTDASKEYLLKNNWEPTIKNLYYAEHSGVRTQSAYQNFDFSQLEKQVEQIIKNAGLTVSEDTMNSCKWLIEKNIALTTHNVKYLDGLNKLSEKLSNGGKSLDIGEIINRIMEAINNGRRPMDALLMEGFSFEDRAEAAMNTIMSAEDCDVAYCVEQQMILSVENLQTAISNRGAEGVVAVSVEMSTNITFITAKRQLEETRLAMTTEANYALLKRGFSIDTKPLEQIVEKLKDLENQYYKDLMNQSGVQVTEENVSIFSATTKYVEELKFQPAYVLQLNSTKESLQNIHASGAALKNTMDTALQSYETLWTAPRKDMGDTIQKAFGNISEILKDLELEDSESNQRAVRILAYNETEITVENITKIKDVDLEMQKLFHNLTPAATLELIRQGENPLDMNIEELNKVVENMQEKSGEREKERFSKFLWKLEQNNGITQEERDSYIGIYRFIAQVERTDGAAIGALLNQGADITMRNLLTAMRSANKDLNYKIDQQFEGVTSNTKGPRIDAQIMSAYQTNCIKEAREVLSPEVLADLEEWENMTPEQLLEALKGVEKEEQAVLEQKYYTEMAQEYQSVLEVSDDVYAFLEKYDVKNSANNILAASRLLENPSNAFDILFDTKGKSQNHQEMIADLKNQVLKNFGEAMKTPEEMAEAQATLAEVAERVMQSMIIENEPIRVKDLKDLRLMSQQFFLCRDKAKEESFLVPVETGDSITGVNLKIVRGKENKGFVDIFFRGALMEKVAASFEAKENGISGVIAATDEQTKQMLEKNLELFVDKMNENEVVDIRVAYVEDLSAWQFEKKTLSEKGESTPVQTKRLYHIAESFIQTMSDLM